MAKLSVEESVALLTKSVKGFNEYHNWQGPAMGPMRPPLQSEGVTLAGADLRGIDLEGADLSKLNLTWCKFDSDLKRVDFTGATLASVKFLGTGHFTSVRFEGATLDNVSLSGKDLGSNLEYTKFLNCGIDQCKIPVHSGGVSFIGGVISGCSFNGVNLFDSRFKNLEIINCSFEAASLTSARISDVEAKINTFADAVNLERAYKVDLQFLQWYIHCREMAAIGELKKLIAKS